MIYTARPIIVALVAAMACKSGPAEDASVPFPNALDAASVSVARLDSILDFGLLVGNGDVNALVHTQGGQLTMMLTKNDVWDARLDSTLDPPLPTLELIERLAKQPAPHGGRSTLLADGWGNHGADSYHAHPYPCPRACGKLILSNRPAEPTWRCIRAEGTHNAWEFRDGVAVMSIQGRAEASNGFSLEPLNMDTCRHDELRFVVSGTENAHYYVDVLDTEGGIIYKSGWTETPPDQEGIRCELPPDKTVDKLILYTWTEDGKRAENRFRQLTFEGPAGSLSIDLADLETPTCSARLDIRRAVVEVAGLEDQIPKSEIRALAARNVFLIRSACQPAIAPVGSADIPSADTGKTAGVDWLLQEIPGDLDWPGMQFAVALASREGLAAVAIVTSQEADAPLQAAIELAASTVGGAAEELTECHEATWQRFWSASGIDLDDQQLSDAWYQNLYFLRCVTKPGVIAPGLFASLVNDRPAWHGMTPFGNGRSSRNKVDRSYRRSPSRSSKNRTRPHGFPLPSSPSG